MDGTPTIPIRRGYDYSRLSPEQAEQARAAKHQLDRFIKAVNTAFVDLCEFLWSMKQRLPYGELGVFIKAEYGPKFWDKASKMIRVRERIGSERFREIRNLDLHWKGTLYELSDKSTPQRAIDRVIAAIDSGELTADTPDRDAFIMNIVEEERGEGSSLLDGLVAGGTTRPPRTPDDQSRDDEDRATNSEIIRFLQAKMTPEAFLTAARMMKAQRPSAERLFNKTFSDLAIDRIEFPADADAARAGGPWLVVAQVRQRRLHRMAIGQPHRHRRLVRLHRRQQRRHRRACGS
jgi:hypothetical protein